MADEEYVSLNPETFVEGGGGLVNDTDGEFSGFKFTMHDLKGGSNLNPYLYASFKAEGDEEHDIWWSCGGAANWEVAPDGKRLKAKGGQKGINKGSNLGIFLASLFNSGFPRDKFGSDIEILNGLQAHIIRVPEPERRGLNRPVREDGRTGGGIVTVSKINKLPWDKAGGKAKGKPAAGKPVADNAALENEVVGIILTSLADNPEGIAKKDIIKAVVAQAAAESRGAAMQMANNDTWLKGRSDWAYDNGVIKLP